MSPKSIALLLILLTANHASARDWPQWWGPARDGIASESFLPATWPKAPVKLWSIFLGSGHSWPVVLGQTVVQHFRKGEQEVIAAFDLKTGRELWRDSYAVSYSAKPEAQGHGLLYGTSATPLVTDGKVIV